MSKLHAKENKVEVKAPKDQENQEVKKRLRQMRYATSLEDFDSSVTENIFELPVKLQQEMQAKGLEARFISLKQYKSNSNMHIRGWKPYVPDDALNLNDGEMDYGVTPEGLVVRGHMVLAAKPAKLVAQYRAAVDQKNKALQSIKERKYDEMRKRMEKHGSKIDTDD